MASWLPQFLQCLVGKEDPPVEDPLLRSDRLFKHAEETRQKHSVQETYVAPPIEKPQTRVHSLGLKDVQRTQVLHTQLVSSFPFPSLEIPDTQNLIFIGKNFQSSSSAQTNIPPLSKNVKGTTIPSGSPSSPAVPRPATQRLVLNDLAKKHQSLVASNACLVPEPDTEKLIYIDSGKNHQSCSSAQTPSLPLGSPSPSSPPIVPTADTSPKFKCKKEPLVSSPSTSGLKTPKISFRRSKNNIWKPKKSHKVPSIDPAPLSSRAESSGSAPVLKHTVTLPVFKIPKSLKRELEDGKVPEVLLKALSQSTYCDYFAALIYAEDYYCKKWSKYTLPAVSLEVRKGSTPYKNKKGNKRSYVVIEMDSVPERRPFLLSRDIVHLKPLDKHEKHVKPFKGTISHVLKKSIIYAEFGDDFISQHSSTCRYDVSFSFNRICMKRCHLSIRAATDSCFHNLLFPDISQRILDINDGKEPLAFNDGNLNVKAKAAVHHILSIWCPPPYLLVGPLSVNVKDELSVTGRVIREAILQIYRANPESRILLASPRNKTCDLLMESLKHDIPNPEMFRINAAFRSVEEVTENVLDVSSYDYSGECFTMSTLTVLRKFRIISTTFMSSFRLYSKGITSGHFSHVFLVDATSAIEPEVLVTLVNLVDDMTAVVVSGSQGDCPNQIRSEISQQYGLRKSYMQRLLESNLDSGSDPLFVSYL